MSVLSWHAGLNVGIGFMDGDHEIAAAQINALAGAAAAERPALLRAFLEHCREHFGREEEMMRQTGFFALACHAEEHSRVLAELEAVLNRLEAGEAQDGYFAQALPQWLLNHRNTMDFVTAEFARKAGYRAA